MITDHLTVLAALTLLLIFASGFAVLHREVPWRIRAKLLSGLLEVMIEKGRRQRRP